MIPTTSLLDAVLAVATVDDVLRDAGLTVPENEKKPLCCPLHSERSPSFFRQRSGKGYRCQGCGARGGVLDLVVALKRASDRKGALETLAARYGLANGLTGHPVRARRVGKPLTQFTFKPPAIDPKVTFEEQASFDNAIKASRKLVRYPGIEAYSRSRGISDALAAACRVGAHGDWLGGGEALLFPGYDRGGTLVCAQGRYVSPTATPKTKSKGKVSLGVFSTPNAFAKGLGPVAIVEAPIDALLLAQAGLPSIATFGSSNRPEWLRKALAFRKVILALDDDAAGREAARWYRNYLNLGTNTSTTLLFDGAKDPGELWEQSRSLEKLAQLVEQAIRAADFGPRALLVA